MNMKVRDVANLFASGYSIKRIAELINITEKQVKTRLRKEGFVYGKEDREWSFTGDDKALDNDFAELNDDGVRVLAGLNGNGQKQEKAVDVMSEQAGVNAFTEEEVLLLKQMAATYMETKTTGFVNTRESIVDALDDKCVGLLSNRKRQSYNVNSFITERLETYAKKMRISQSDLVELAIVELLDKYGE